MALDEQLEDQPDLLRLDRVDGELLLDPCPAPLRLHRGVAKWGSRAVPEALPRVLLHRAQDVLGVLLRLVFVEQGNHLPHHHLRRVVAQLLCDRDQPDFVLGQLAHVELEAEGVTEEARERVHDDHVEGVLAVAGALDHALELGAFVVGRGRAGLHVLGDRAPAALRRPGPRLGLLVRDGQILLGLAAGGDAQVDRRSQRRCLCTNLHGGCRSRPLSRAVHATPLPQAGAAHASTAAGWD